MGRLEGRLGHRFKDPDLLREALTHSSAAAGRTLPNERLEFLGDRVLGLVCAELLHHRFAQAPEGDLAQKLNALVRRETCARMAERLEVGRALAMDGAEAKTGGRKKQGLLADAMEAIIAALYLDGGLEVARAMILSHWADEIDGLEEIAADPKTELQEWTQKRWNALPDYELVERSGPDHKPSFTVQVSLPTGEAARGEGASKRAAEKAAAEAMLLAQGLRSP